MSIYSVLRHRATVNRSTKNQTTGAITWTTVRSNLPCLLTDSGVQAEAPASETAAPAGRTGTLFAAPGADVRPGDRVTGSRGFTGTFKVTDDAHVVTTPTGLHHLEFKVSES